MNGFAIFAATFAELRARNVALRSRVCKLERSRDQWKAKAVARKRRIEELERQPRKRRRPTRKQTYTAEQWRQHYAMVERIRAIPNRDILDPE